MKTWRFMTLASVLVIWGCGSKSGNENTGNPEKFPVVKPMVKDTFLTNEYVADIEAEKNVEIRLRISGFVDNIYVKEGQEIRQGDLLFYINDAEYKTHLASMKAMLASARAEVQVAQVEQKRVKSLVSQNILSPSEEDVANSKLEAARAKAEEAASQVAFAEIQLSYTRIKAPFNGVIDRIPLKQGSLVKEGDLLTTISDIKNVYAYFHISEIEYLSILKADWVKNGEARLVLSDGSLYPFLGKIEAAESEIDEGTGSIAFKAFFPNPEKLLKHGASGKLQIRIPSENTLLIPQKCIFEQQDKNYVYVVDAANTVRRRSIETGRRLGNLIIVNSGLSKDEILIYEGLQLVKEGQVIIPEPLITPEI